MNYKKIKDITKEIVEMSKTVAGVYIYIYIYANLTNRIYKIKTMYKHGLCKKCYKIDEF